MKKKSKTEIASPDTVRPHVEDLSKYLIDEGAAIRDAIVKIDLNAGGIVLVVGPGNRLIRTLTDGDIRRAILAGHDLDLPVASVSRRPDGQQTKPFTAPIGTLDTALIRMMDRHSLRHIPLVDKAGSVRDLALLSDLVKEYEAPLEAVIMAGGAGVRLRPLTENIPKPMLPVGERPLLELILEQLRKSGIHDMTLTTHYKGEVIRNHFGDGVAFGVNLRYIDEDEPLGTAGALRLLKSQTEPILVMNGDILTKLDFRAMLDFHRHNHADITIAVREFEFEIPYGVVESSGTNVVKIVEKPKLKRFVNAGIYLVQPAVCARIPESQRYDMPELISSVIADGGVAVSFPIREYWLDIGQHADYQRAQKDFTDPVWTH